MPIAFCVLTGFVLGHRLQLFGFIMATLIVAGSSFAIEYSLLTMALCAGAFQLAVFISMRVIRFACDP